MEKKTDSQNQHKRNEKRIRCSQIFTNRFFVFFGLFGRLKDKMKDKMKKKRKFDLRFTSPAGGAALPLSLPFESINFERPSTVRAPK
jgi:hypothetical protein